MVVNFTLTLCHRKLNHVASLEGLRHVKRIKKTSLDGGSCWSSVLLSLHFRFLNLLIGGSE